MPINTALALLGSLENAQSDTEAMSLRGQLLDLCNGLDIEYTDDSAKLRARLLRARDESSAKAHALAQRVVSLLCGRGKEDRLSRASNKP
jgi:hypothetical protein